MIRHPSLDWLRQSSLFRNYLAASTISQLGSNIFDIAMPIYVWNRTQSPIALSLVTVALTLPYLLMSPFTGYAVDHFNNRRIMIAADVGQILTLLALLFFENSGADALWPLLLAVFTIKTLYILFETVASFHLIPAIVPRESLQDANTWFLSSLRLIQVVGPLAGGFIMEVAGFNAAAALNLISFGTTLYFTLRMKNLSEILHKDRPISRKGRLNPKAVYRSFTESLHYIWKSPMFRPFIFAMFFWNLTSLTPTAPSVTYFFLGVSNYTSAQFATVAALCGFFGLVGFFTSSHFYKTLSFYKTFVGSCVWQAVFGTLALAFFKVPALFALVFSLSRVGSSVFSMGTFFIRQTEVPKNRVGAVNASIRMHFMLAAPLSAMVQGFILKHAGVMLSFSLGAICLWGTLWYGYLVGKAYDSHLRERHEPLAA